MKRKISVLAALLLIAAALFARLLLPGVTARTREVFFATGAFDRIAEVFAPDA